MISKIQQSNNVIPPVVNRPTGQYSPAYFTSSKPSQDKSQNQSKMIWGALALGSAIALAVIGKKEFPTLKLKWQIKKSYDKIWENVLKTVDQTKIQIEKPKLKFSYNKNAVTKGEYDVGINTIKVNLDFFRTHKYLVCDKANTTILASNEAFLHSLANIEELKKSGLIKDGWIVKELNDKERLLWISQTLAHEQRHCVQHHLILNDANYGAESLLKNKISVLKTERPDLSDEQLNQTVRKMFPYVANFKPKQILRDLRLLSTFSCNGQRVSFLTKHLVRNDLEYTMTNWEKYNLNSYEIDANAFALSYLKNHTELQNGCDNIVINSIINMLSRSSNQNVLNFIKENKRYLTPS